MKALCPETQGLFGLNRKLGERDTAAEWTSNPTCTALDDVFPWQRAGRAMVKARLCPWGKSFLDSVSPRVYVKARQRREPESLASGLR